MGTPISFSGLRRDRERIVLNARKLDKMGSVWSWILGKENFPHFSGKNLVPKKCDGNADNMVYALEQINASETTQYQANLTGISGILTRSASY